MFVIVAQQTEEPVVEVEKKKKKSEDQISKYRELLRGIQDKEKKLQEDKDMEMEITWVPGTTTPFHPCVNWFVVSCWNRQSYSPGYPQTAGTSFSSIIVSKQL